MTSCCAQTTSYHPAPALVPCSVHRDIKPENILLSDNTEGATLKLADFGLSAIIPTTTSEQPHLNSNMLTDAVGTSYYVAPEVRGSALGGRGLDLA